MPSRSGMGSLYGADLTFSPADQSVMTPLEACITNVLSAPHAHMPVSFHTSNLRAKPPQKPQGIIGIYDGRI
jgi:hypothetical protein